MKKHLPAFVFTIGVMLVAALVYFAPDIKEHFGTRFSSADREIFENSKAYIHGSIENLQRLRLEYETAESDQHRRAIKTMVLSQTTNLDKSQIPYDLRQWMESL